MPEYTFGPEGEDVGAEDFNTMGATPRAPRPGMRRRPAGQRIYQQPPLPAAAAQNVRSKMRSFMGVGFTEWLSADATDKLLTVTPQESFRPGRMVIKESTVNGPAAGVLLVKGVTIGTSPQSPAVGQPAPASMFAPEATYSRLDMQVCFRAMTLNVQLGVTAAPGGTAVVTAAVGFYGDWIR